MILTALASIYMTEARGLLKILPAREEGISWHTIKHLGSQCHGLLAIAKEVLDPIDDITSNRQICSSRTYSVLWSITSRSFILMEWPRSIKHGLFWGSASICRILCGRALKAGTSSEIVALICRPSSCYEITSNFKACYSAMTVLTFVARCRPLRPRQFLGMLLSRRGAVRRRHQVSRQHSVTSPQCIEYWTRYTEESDAEKVARWESVRKLGLLEAGRDWFVFGNRTWIQGPPNKLYIQYIYRRTLHNLIYII